MERTDAHAIADLTVAVHGRHHLCAEAFLVESSLEAHGLIDASEDSDLYRPLRARPMTALGAVRLVGNLRRARRKPAAFLRARHPLVGRYGFHGEGLGLRWRDWFGGRVDLRCGLGSGRRIGLGLSIGLGDRRVRLDGKASGLERRGERPVERQRFLGMLLFQRDFGEPAPPRNRRRLSRRVGQDGRLRVPSPLAPDERTEREGQAENYQGDDAERDPLRPPHRPTPSLTRTPESHGLTPLDGIYMLSGAETPSSPSPFLVTWPTAAHS